MNKYTIIIDIIQKNFVICKNFLWCTNTSFAKEEKVCLTGAHDRML